MTDFTIELDMARDLPKVRRAFNRIIKHQGKCSYAAPCAIGVMMTPAERMKLVRRDADEAPVHTLISQGFLIVPADQRHDFEVLQEEFDNSPPETFERILTACENKYLGEQVSA